MEGGEDNAGNHQGNLYCPNDSQWDVPIEAPDDRKISLA